jgi:hypothetical protein
MCRHRQARPRTATARKPDGFARCKHHGSLSFANGARGEHRRHDTKASPTFREEYARLECERQQEEMGAPLGQERK